MHLNVFRENLKSSDLLADCQGLGIPIDISVSPMPETSPLNDKKGIYWGGIGEGKDSEKQVLETIAFITYLMENRISFPAVSD